MEAQLDGSRKFEAMWKRMFPQFESLPKHMRRHDINLLIRIIVAIPVAGLALYVIVNTFQDIEWYLANREFVSTIVLVYLIFDLFELSQRRQFELQPWMHHCAQTFYSLYYLEWGPSNAYTDAMPLSALLLFATMARPIFGIYPLKRVASPEQVTSYAKFAFTYIMVVVAASLGVMVSLIIRYRDILPKYALIIQPISFLVFNCIDLGIYIYIYKRAYNSCTEDNSTPMDDVEGSLDEVKTPRPRRRSSVFEDVRASIKSIPYYDTYEDEDLPIKK